MNNNKMDYFGCEINYSCNECECFESDTSSKKEFLCCKYCFNNVICCEECTKNNESFEIMGDKMIVYRFDKERFNKNADKGIKRILSKHLDYIDNLEVKFIDGEEWGTVENYVVGQERYCLYPVKKEWCSIEEQLRII